MQHLLNRMRAEAMRAQGLFNGTRIGIVSGYDPDAYAAKVVVMPEGGDPDADPGDAETGWLPISTIWSGPGWGCVCPPSVGEQVVIEHAEGDVGSGIIAGRVFDADHLPPSAAQSGEFWLVHKSGAFIKLTNDGKVTFQDSDGDILQLGGNSAALTAGTINIGSTGQALHKLVTDAFVTFFNGHSHPSNGAPPSQPMTSAHLTSTVNAG